MGTALAAGLRRGLDRANDLLDRFVLPWPVRFLTFRFVILITIGLLVPLLAFANNTVLVLSINSYLNTMSVAVSSIVLLYATIQEARQKQIAEMQERRAAEDHTHVTEMHRLLQETLADQQRQIEALKQMLAGQHGTAYAPSAPAAPPDLQALHPRGGERFAEDDLDRRWQAGLVHSPLVTTLRPNPEDE